MSDMLWIVLIGAGATGVMDLWGMARKRLLGIPSLDYALVGRWIGHMGRGKFLHERIASASSIAGERALGWSFHYITGVVFSGAFVWIVGFGWLHEPALAPALVFGIATVLVPFLLMQPAMGAGIAASRTPRPNSARLQSLITHTVFGLGLWIMGCAARYLGW